MRNRMVGWIVAVAIGCVAGSMVIAQEAGKLTEEERKGLEAEVKRLWEEAQRLDKEGKVKEAIASGQRKLAVNRKLLGNEHDDVASSLEWLAERYEQIEDFPAAKTAAQEVLEIRMRLLGKEHWQVTDARLALAHVDSIAGLTAGQRRQLANANRRNDEAERLYGEGKYQDALRAAAEAAEIRKQLLGETNRDYATSRNNLGVMYLTMGDHARAEPLYREAMEIRKKVLGETHPHYAISLNNLGALYYETGDYARAEPLWREALEIRKKASDDPDYALTLNNLAALYRKMRDYGRAEPLYRQGLEIRKKALGETHPDYATSLNSLAGIYLAKGDYARAEPLYRQVLEIRETALGETHPHYALSLNNLAALYHSRGDPARAEPLYAQALEITKKVLGETHPDYASRLNNLALLYQSMGDYARAEPMFRQGLLISRKNLDLAASVQSERQQLAMLWTVRYQLDTLVSLAATAPQYCSAVFDEVLVWKGLVLGRQQAIRAVAERPELASVVEELQTTATKLARLSFATPTPAQAPAWRAQIAALSAKKESLEARLAGASREYREASQPMTTADLRAALPEEAALVDFLQFWTREATGKDQAVSQRWERRLAAFVVRSFSGVKFVDLGPVDPLNAAIAAWRSDDGQSPGSRQAAQVLREKIWLPVEQHLAGAAMVLVSPDGKLGTLPFVALPGRAPGAYLLEDYSLAVIPAPQAIARFARRRASPADGAITATKQVPDATPTRALGSLAPTTVGGNMLIIAGVNYNSRMGLGVERAWDTKVAADSRAVRDEGEAPFAELPGTNGELAAIEKLYRERIGGEGLARLEGGSATQEAVVRAAPHYRYLHLATHGFFAAARFNSVLERSTADFPAGEQALVSNQSLAGYHPGLLSGLVLAGANQPNENDDGILTAEELSGMNLRNVELVVLSACETGLGRWAGGEGLLGLQRAFQAAGARSVVASLWSVPDQATKMLMVRFYENLWKKKMGKLEALREAQLWMLEQGAEQPAMRRELAARGLVAAEGTGYGKQGTGDGRQGTGNSKRLPPYFWGAWVLSGDWR